MWVFGERNVKMGKEGITQSLRLWGTDLAFVVVTKHNLGSTKVQRLDFLWYVKISPIFSMNNQAISDWGESSTKHIHNSVLSVVSGLNAKS